MKLLFSTVILLGSINAFACPKLVGNYKCIAEGDVDLVTIAESQITNGTLYTFSPKLMGLYSQLATTGATEVGNFFRDKILPNGKPLFTNDYYRSVCSGKDIVSQWKANLMNWRGDVVKQEWSGLTNIVTSEQGFTVLDNHQFVYKFENDRVEKRQFLMICERL